MADCIVVAMVFPHFDESATVVTEVDAQLVAVEFGEIAFVVKRIFTITRHGEMKTRGNHHAGGYQKLVLLSGAASLHLKKQDEEVQDFHLSSVGDAVSISPDDFVTYELLEDGAQILVLADQSYEESRAQRKKSL